MLTRRTVLATPVAAALVPGAAALADAGSAGSPSSGTSAARPRQSPINITRRNVRYVRGLPQLEFRYGRDAAVSLAYASDTEEDGCDGRGEDETERVTVEEGAGHVLFRGTRYDLAQFHFHTPSEHTVLGRHAPLEMHLVHFGPEGERLVVGVLLVEGPAGEVDRILRRLPDECDDAIEIDDFDLRALVPSRNRALLRYPGSLTTPPYSEPTRWFLTVPGTASREGIRNFQALFPDGDSRATQPLNGRRVVADRGWEAGAVVRAADADR